MTAMNSLWHHIVVLTTVPVLFSVILNDLILLTRWPRILTFESVLGIFRFWEQLPMGREGRVRVPNADFGAWDTGLEMGLPCIAAPVPWLCLFIFFLSF